MDQTVWLVRHGETVYNKEGRFQGCLDVPLSAEGERQASKVAARLGEEKVEAVYSSRLKRAYRTANLIAAPHGLPVRIIDGMEEMGFGRWEGKSFFDLEEDEKDAAKSWFNDPVTNVIPEGEAISQFQQRINQAYHKLLEEVNGKDTVLVTHGGVIKVILVSILGVSLSMLPRLYVSLCSLTVVRYFNGLPLLTLFNDTCYLD